MACSVVTFTVITAGSTKPQTLPTRLSASTTIQTTTKNHREVSGKQETRRTVVKSDGSSLADRNRTKKAARLAAKQTLRDAALGINLWTSTKVTVSNQAYPFVERNLNDAEKTPVIETIARRILRRFRVDRQLVAIVETHFNIPTSAGLKSSSAASNTSADRWQAGGQLLTEEDHNRALSEWVR